jgi:hypothetical protein
VISLCLVIRVEAEITKRCSVCGGLFSLVGRNWYVVSENRFGLGDR